MSRVTNTINEPNPGQVVIYWGDFNSKNPKPSVVYITGGEYYSGGRLSNFWDWRFVNRDGTLGNEDCGYGSFSKIQGVRVEGFFLVDDEGITKQKKVKVSFPKGFKWPTIEQRPIDFE